MKKWLERLRPRVEVHRRWEHYLLRALYAGVIFDIIPWHLNPKWAAMPNPNGIAKLIPFGWMAEAGVMDWLQPVVLASLVIYVLGFVPLVALFPALFTILGAGAVWASQREGASQHSVQLVAMVVLAQYFYLAWRAIQRRKFSLRIDPALADGLIHVSKWVVAVTYVACAFMKLKSNGLGWFQKGPAMAVQTIKTNLQGYYTSADMELNEWLIKTAPKIFTDYPVASGLFFGIGLLLELFAWLILINRRWALGIGGALLVMHVMIWWLTTIKFTSHIYTVAVLCVVPGVVGLFLGRATAVRGNGDTSGIAR